MSKKATRYIVALVVLAIAITGGVYYAVAQHSRPLTDKQFAQLPIEQQFEKAPAGHYVHLLKNDPTLYRTTWSKKKIIHYLDYTAGTVKTNQDGTSSDKTTFGTNHTFDDSILVDSEKGYGEIGRIFFSFSDNSKAYKQVEYVEEHAYNWYFDSVKDAQKDADVSANVTQIVR